jgi:hypothetical protein
MYQMIFFAGLVFVVFGRYCFTRFQPKAFKSSCKLEGLQTPLIINKNIFMNELEEGRFSELN